MRKHIVDLDPAAQRSKEHTSLGEQEWLDLEAIAVVEVSSENPVFPIENALVPEAGGAGWRAASAGKHTILLRFDTPQRVQRVFLRFVEQEHERAQEFRLTWTGGGQSGEIVRQQWTFSPGGATTEEETYSVNLPLVSTLRLEIDPDRGQNRYSATLAVLRLG